MFHNWVRTQSCEACRQKQGKNESALVSRAVHTARLPNPSMQQGQDSTCDLGL